MPGSCGRSEPVSGNAFQICHRPHEVPVEVGAFLCTIPLQVKHRLAYASAIQFTTTYFNINVNDYGLKDADLAVVLVARHLSTLFAYSDAIWAKYGKPI